MTKPNQHLVRESIYPEETIKAIADCLTQRFYTGGELLELCKSYGMHCSTHGILSLLEVRGYLCIETDKRPGIRTRYKIVTADDYEKYEKEKTEDAKKRLLATISY